MGNCVARDMGFDTDNIEKNKELLRKMQERINHKRTMSKLAGSGTDSSDDDSKDDEDSKSDFSDSKSIEKQIDPANKSDLKSGSDLSREHGTLPLSMVINTTNPEIKPFYAELQAGIPESLMGLTPIVKNNDNEQLFFGSNKWQTKDLQTEHSSDEEEEAKEITISARGMEVIPMKKNRESNPTDKSGESKKDSMNLSHQAYSHRSQTYSHRSQTKSTVTEKNPQEPRFQGLEVRRSEENYEVEVHDFDVEGFENPPMIMAKSGGAFSKIKKREGIEKVDLSKIQTNGFDKSAKSLLSVASPQSRVSHSLFGTEVTDRVEPGIFENRFFKDEIVSKLQEKTPMAAHRHLRIFPDGFDSEENEYG